MVDSAIKKLQVLMGSNYKNAAAFFKRQLRLDRYNNPVARFQFVRKSAILGLFDAIPYVVDAYQKGDGVEPSTTKAFEWILKAANAGNNHDFAFDLACCYRDGDGTARDIGKFWNWMTKAANAGLSEAMFHLASAHMNPDLEDFSPERAVYWTRRMADLGAPGALVQLARKYADGENVDRNPEESFRHAEKAVSAASKQWDDRHKANADWTYEDLPEALAALADACLHLERAEDARCHNDEAAMAAWNAYVEAKTIAETVGEALPTIMLRRLPHFKGASGQILKRNQRSYFIWLDRIREVTAYVYSSKETIQVPEELNNAMYELAIAHRDSTGTERNAKKCIELLREVANRGHGRAAYECALHYLNINRRVDFEHYIARAADSNDMNAMILHQLASSSMSKKDLLKTLGVLQDLRQAVVRIRNEKHKVDLQKVPDGIAHYTDAIALTNMLSGSPLDGKNVVRLSNTTYVNDPTEGRRLRTFNVKSGGNPLDQLYAGLSNEGTISWRGSEFHVFLACFSLERDSLNLWRFYGRDGTGYSVVSPPSAFDAESAEGMIRGPWARREKKPSKLTLYKVLYDDKDVEYALGELAKPLASVTGLFVHFPDCANLIRNVAAAVISDLLYLYKDSQYEDEKEVRAVEARTLSDPEVKEFQAANMPYSKLFLESGAILFREKNSQILIGPKVEKADAIMIDLQHRLARMNWARTCTVSRSKKPYR